METWFDRLKSVINVFALIRFILFRSKFVIRRSNKNICRKIIWWFAVKTCTRRLVDNHVDHVDFISSSSLWWVFRFVNNRTIALHLCDINRDAFLLRNLCRFALELFDTRSRRFKRQLPWYAQTCTNTVMLIQLPEIRAGDKSTLCGWYEAHYFPGPQSGFNLKSSPFVS